MKSLLRFAALSAAVFPLAARAQEDTAHHRAVYAETEKNVSSYRRAKATFKDDPIVFELQGWFYGAELRKILSVIPGEDGGGSEEYYLEKGRPLFVFSRYRNAAGKPVENRFYFAGGQLFKWLGADKKSVPPGNDDFKSEAERLTGNAANFVAAFKGKAPAAKPAARTATGTFLGIDQGDYAHWQMRTESGEERSFFILRPDASVEAVLAKPKPFQGRRCRVQWKESVENLPEAGGKTTVEQILSVEWLAKK